MMVCPKCAAVTKVLTTIGVTEMITNTKTIRRRRECVRCSARFSTYEVHSAVLSDLSMRSQEVEDARQELIDNFCADLPPGSGIFPPRRVRPAK